MADAIDGGFSVAVVQPRIVLTFTTQRTRNSTKGGINNVCNQALVPFRRAGHDNPAGATAVGYWFLNHGGHQPLFLRHARTKSSTVALSPSSDIAARIDSCASICLNPSAINPST